MDDSANDSAGPYGRPTNWRALNRLGATAGEGGVPVLREQGGVGKTVPSDYLTDLAPQSKSHRNGQMQWLLKLTSCHEHSAARLGSRQIPFDRAGFDA
jgi:hypothetical protein